MMCCYQILQWYKREILPVRCTTCSASRFSSLLSVKRETWNGFVEVTKGTGTRVSTSYYIAHFLCAMAVESVRGNTQFAFYALRRLLYYTRNSHFLRTISSHLITRFSILIYEKFLVKLVTRSLSLASSSLERAPSEARVLRNSDSLVRR